MSEEGHETSAKRAPEPLEPVRRFVNTRNRMRGYDLLEDAESAGRWLAEVGYGAAVVEQGELERLHVLREGLRDLLTAHTLGASGRQTRSAVRLEELCASVALRPRFSPEGEPRLVTAAEGVEQLIGDLLAATVWAGHAGIWSRLKACANEDCRWAFYDHSKNRSGNWCVMEICGSRAKMRAYRQRNASRSSKGSR